MDKISKERRSRNMQKIRAKDTQPELIVRKWLFSQGYRYRLHSGKLPGKPDIVFPGKKKVIFVNGCFWHQHDVSTCQDSHRPKSNIDYWLPKLERTVNRDRENQNKLLAMGYKFLILWECELKDKDKFLRKVNLFLSS